MHDFEGWSWHEIAREMRVNVSYVYNYAVNGVKPKSRLIRKKMRIMINRKIRKISTIDKWKLLIGLNDKEINFILHNKKRMNE